MLGKLQKKIPLHVRITIGPLVAYLFYFFHTHIVKNAFKPTVLSIEKTLDLIKDKNLSVIRFGDGEISLIENTKLGFQNNNPELAEKMKKILQSNHEKLLVCILNIWDNNIATLEKNVYRFELHHFLKHKTTWEKLISPTQVYGDAFITRPYITLKDKGRSQNIFKKIKYLWKDESVILIEGEKSRLGVGNDLFKEVRSLQRILCPAENAFSKYNEIKTEAFKIPKDNLILISLGPTAKVLAYDMFLAGYRVLDIGHIDMEYEMFLRQETKLVKVPYKYFNEINERNPDDCTDAQYLSEILTKVS